MDGIGFGIGLGGTPRDAMRLSEKNDAYNSAYGNSSSKQGDKQRAKEEAEYNRIVANDFKIDPKIYHKKLLPKVQQESAAALNEIAKAHERDPFNGLNNVQQILMNYKSRLSEYQAQSKNFFDFESQDPTKYHVDPNIIKILNSNPGNLKDLEEYAGLTRGTKGLTIGQDGYAYFSPIPKVDFNKYIETFSKNPAAYNESPDKPKPSGIAGIMQMGTTFIPNPEIVGSLGTTMKNDPVVLQNLLYGIDPTNLPPDLDLTKPESIGKYKDKLVDDWMGSNIKPYKTFKTANVPKEPKDPNTDFQGKIVKVGNDTTYQVGNNIWTLSKNPNGDYWLSVNTKNKTEAADQKDMDWFLENSNGRTQHTGKLSGYSIKSGNRFTAVITKPKMTTEEETFSGTTSGTTKRPAKAIDREIKDIGWNNTIRDQSVSEYGGDPMEIYEILLKAKFGQRASSSYNLKDTGMGSSEPQQPAKKVGYKRQPSGTTGK